MSKKNKVYQVTVGTRHRITVPFDCWMDAGKMPQLKMRIQTEGEYWWDPCVGMTPSMSYRVALSNYPIGTKLNLIPSKNLNGETIIRVEKA